MTVRCQLLVLLILVSSVVSGPTRGAAETPDGSSSAPPPAPEGPKEAMTSQQPETSAPVQEPPMTPSMAPPSPETTTKAGPEVGAKISLTESSAVATTLLTEPPSTEPDTASSALIKARAKQTSSEEPATTEPERCAEPAPGVTDGSPTETCESSGTKDSDSGSADNGCIVDDREYPDGARVSGPQDPCRPCFCHRKRVTCVELRCYTRRGCKPLFKAGVCCPTYDHCPPAMVNASGEMERSDSNPEDPEDATGLENVTTDRLTEETAAGPVAHLVDSPAHKDDDSEDESRSDQDDDDGDDHDHSHHHHRQHHMLDPVTPLTSSATTLRPGTSFPFLVRGRAGVEVR